MKQLFLSLLAIGFLMSGCNTEDHKARQDQESTEKNAEQGDEDSQKSTNTQE
jgi:uncharacterized protein YceK